MFLILDRDGARDSGLFIGAMWLLKMAETYQEVDVFDTVRQIRATRPEFIGDMVSKS